MSTAEAMSKIEGHRFSALTNLASGFKTFLHILGDQPEVKALAEAMKDERVARHVFARLLELAGSSFDEDYEHPADAAMAAYLWLLSEKARDLSETAAETVLRCRQCWWSRKMAEQVRRGPRASTSSPSEDGATSRARSEVDG